MAFVITKDLINDGNAVGEWWSFKDLNVVQVEKICKHRFRLSDDDDNVYFEGLSSDNSSFAALDLFGGSYGCTSIEYYENGKWEYL